MPIGHESTAAQYQQYRPMQLRTGDELDKYLADQSSMRAQAAKDRDSRKKSADKIAEAAKLEMPDAKHKMQSVIGSLHQSLQPEMAKTLTKRQDLINSGMHDTKEYYDTFADESRIRGTLGKYKNAFDFMEKAQLDLAKGIEDGTYSKKRNLALLENLTGFATGSQWDFEDGKFAVKDRHGNEIGKYSAEEMTMNPYLGHEPKEYYDWDKWITDTAKGVGSRTTDYVDPATGEKITTTDVKDVNKFRGVLRNMINANPDLLQEYQADHNGPNTPNEELATADDLIDDVMDESKLFGDSSRTRTAAPKEGKGTYLEKYMKPEGSSNAIIHTQDGKKIHYTNPTKRSMPLTYSVKGGVSLNLGRGMVSFKDEPTTTMGGKPYNARQMYDIHTTIEDFVPNVVAEERLYHGPRLLIEGFSEEEATKTSNRLITAPVAMAKTEVKRGGDKEYGMYLEPGQYVPEGLMNEVSGGNVLIHRVDDGNNITDDVFTQEQVNENSTWTGIIKGTAKGEGGRISFDIPIVKENQEAITAINGESKGTLNEWIEDGKIDMSREPIQEEVIPEETAIVEEETTPSTRKKAKKGFTQYTRPGYTDVFNVPNEAIEEYLEENPGAKPVK